MNEYDDRLEAALKEDDWQDAAHIIQKALESSGLAESVERILQAKYLYLVRDAYERRVWPEMDTYENFALWVQGYYERTPHGKKLKTVMGLTTLWEFYAVRLGKSVEWLAACGKAKLERMMGTARRTLQEDGTLDADVEAVLEDGEVGFAQVMDEYKSRAGIEIEEPDDNQVSYRMLANPGDGRPAGVLERWQDGLSDDIGVLDIKTQEEQVIEFCERAKVKVA